VHAKNYLDKEPALPPPVYAPELVAEAILFSAQHQKRDVYIGGHAKFASVGEFTMPRTLDRFMRATAFRQQQTDMPSAPGRRDALHAPDQSSELRQRQGMPRSVHERSPYTALALRSRPVATALLGLGALFAARGLTRRFAR
jgi:hypothetical protein